VLGRFGHAKEEQSDAHAGTEEHCQPGKRREFRFGVGPSETNGAEPADTKGQQAEEVDVDREDEKPAAVLGN
jgi:hypothetical protein